MTNKRITRDKGYSKKELLQIIGDIDADRSQMRQQAEAQNREKEESYNHRTTGMVTS